MRIVTRISNTPAGPFSAFFNKAGKSLSWDPADEGGSPQGVEDSVADAIEGDPSLAPHFRCEPIPSAESSTGGPAVRVAAASESKRDGTAGAVHAVAAPSKATPPAK